MNRKIKSLPFDERNQQDFEEITQKINNALDIIRQNSKVPATQGKLASLAECSRKTLHNRKEPIAELKKIKQQRKAAKESNLKRKKDSVGLIEHEDSRVEIDVLIKNYQQQNGQLFGQVQELEIQVRELLSLNAILYEENKVLIEKNNQLNSELKQYGKQSISPSNVISIVR